MRFPCHGHMVSSVSARSALRKCHTIPFFGRFLESCYIAHPRSRAKVSGKPVRGYEIGGKTAFRQEKCCTIRNLPRKSESCDKIRRFLPWLLIPGRFPRHGIRHGPGVRTVGQEAQWRAQGLPIAIVEEIAFENGWIMRDQLMESAERYGKSPYGQHLKGIADGEIMLVPNQKN